MSYHDTPVGHSPVRRGEERRGEEKREEKRREEKREEKREGKRREEKRGEKRRKEKKRGEERGRDGMDVRISIAAKVSRFGQIYKRTNKRARLELINSIVFTS